MEFQFHPASGRGAVRSLALGDRGERVLLGLVGVAVILAGSVGVTVPSVCRRVLRAERAAVLSEESDRVVRDRRDLEARVSGLRERALDGGDLVARVAFLYGLTASGWPRSLNPEAGILAGRDAELLVYGLRRYAGALGRAVSLVAEREAADPGIASRTPSILPLSSDLVVPASRFGPRVSPWTGTEEFFAGMDLAAPPGTPVLAPASGTVIFAGRVPSSSSARLWRFGNLVVLSHGPAGVTVFGHLAKIDVRRGERVVRGARLGTVGASGWAVSPALHYEYWRRGEEGLSPTDPRFAMLDFRLAGHDVSLERMRATSAPRSVEPPPDR